MENKYTIKEIGHLGLGYKTIVTRIIPKKDNIDFETKTGNLKDGLDIYLWDDDFSHRWSIATFELDKNENCFELHEVGDRLCNPDIDYMALKELITLGHDMLMEAVLMEAEGSLD